MNRYFAFSIAIAVCSVLFGFISDNYYTYYEIDKRHTAIVDKILSTYEGAVLGKLRYVDGVYIPGIGTHYYMCYGFVIDGDSLYVQAVKHTSYIGLTKIADNDGTEHYEAFTAYHNDAQIRLFFREIHRKESFRSRIT